MNKKHKHCELIKAWADGAVIELKDDYGCWEEVAFPSWMLDKQYRIKPEPKPDRIGHGFISLDRFWKDSLLDLGYHIDFDGYDPIEKSKVNLKLTFDGETGELKSAEVLK